MPTFCTISGVRDFNSKAIARAGHTTKKGTSTEVPFVMVI